jgi:rhodanese-related sulfurtransferase
MKTTELPKFQHFHIDGVVHISPEDAMQELSSGNAVMIDVREADELEIDKFVVNNVYNHPMSVILNRLSSIPTDKNIIVACHVGERSVKVVNLLNIKQFANVANLDGGVKMWKLFGLPIESKTQCNTHTCGSCSQKNESGCC